MMNMGNGEHTATTCLEHIKELMSIHTELSGVQQMAIGHSPASGEEMLAAQQDYQERVAKFLKRLRRDLT